MIKIEPNGKPGIGIESLIIAAHNVLLTEEVEQIKEIYGKKLLRYRQDPENHYLASMYEVLVKSKTINKDREIGKIRFNGVLIKQMELITGEDLESIVTNSLIKTIENYHGYLTQKGYLREGDITVEPYERGIRIRMKHNCPYQSFCIETEHDKCPRGTTAKDLCNRVPDGKEYVNILRKSSEGCDILVIPRADIIDELSRSIESNGKGDKNSINML